MGRVASVIPKQRLKEALAELVDDQDVEALIEMAHKWHEDHRGGMHTNSFCNCGWHNGPGGPLCHLLTAIYYLNN